MFRFSSVRRRSRKPFIDSIVKIGKAVKFCAVPNEKRRSIMESKDIRTKSYASALFVAAVFFFLPFSSEAQAGGIDIRIGIGIPFSGYVVSPPLVYPPPRVVIVSPPHRYHRPLVSPHHGYYRPYVAPRYGYSRPQHPSHRYYTSKDRKYSGELENRRRRR
jgi:hypothetical protein